MTPRPASEQLVEAALARLGGGPGRVVDVGTGSGAIAVALAVAAPELEVWATDASAAAVDLARRSAALNGVAERVHVRQGDLLDPVPGELDLVVANLPYLPLGGRRDRPELADEPIAALFAAGDGLGPYRRLLREVEARLRPGGCVLIQLHRRVFEARHGELVPLSNRLPELARAA